MRRGQQLSFLLLETQFLRLVQALFQERQLSAISPWFESFFVNFHISPDFIEVNMRNNLISFTTKDISRFISISIMDFPPYFWFNYLSPCQDICHTHCAKNSIAQWIRDDKVKHFTLHYAHFSKFGKVVEDCCCFTDSNKENFRGHSRENNTSIHPNEGYGYKG